MPYMPNSDNNTEALRLLSCGYYSNHNCFLAKLYLPQVVVTVFFCVLLCTNLAPAWDKDPLGSVWAVQSSRDGWAG